MFGMHDWLCNSPPHAADDTEFYRQGSSSAINYESVKYPGNYLTVDSQGSFSIGSNAGNFKHEFLGGNKIGVYADVSGQAHRCYLAFDINGNQVSNPCASDLDIELAKVTELISY